MKRLLFMLITISLLFTGCLIIRITPELNNPLIISLSGTKEVLKKGDTMTITVTVTDENGSEVRPDKYEWYLQGVKFLENTDSVTIGSDLEPGTYVLDIIITKSDILSSETFTFTVTE